MDAQHCLTENACYVEWEDSLSNKKIRVGIVGASARRGFASLAHIPALKALPDFEFVAVCTTRQESADAAAKQYGVPLAFDSYEEMARHPDVDLVTVSVKVPEHFKPVMAAIEAGKHIYSEWPLGRTTQEAVQMYEAAEKKGVFHVVGLQGQVSAAVNYAKDLVADGYVGRVCAATMVGSAPSLGPSVEAAYVADIASGANMLTITSGHQLDAFCYCLGEFRELSAFMLTQRDQILDAATGKMVPKNTPDQVMVNGIIGADIAATFQMRAGSVRGTEFMFEIHGDKGDLLLTSTLPGASMQRQELRLRGGRESDKSIADMPIPEKYHWAPKDVPQGTPYNVAQSYLKLAAAVRDGKPASPGFDAAVTRHRMIDAIIRAAETGQKQKL